MQDEDSEMKDAEIQAFEAKYGYKPTKVAVAIDVLAVYVNKDNPLKGLTVPQVDAIFSATRKCGGEKDLRIRAIATVGLEVVFDDPHEREAELIDQVDLRKEIAKAGFGGFFRGREIWEEMQAELDSHRQHVFKSNGCQRYHRIRC